MTQIDKKQIATCLLTIFLLTKQIIPDNIFIEEIDGFSAVRIHGTTSQLRNNEKLNKAFVKFINAYNNAVSPYNRVNIWGVETFPYDEANSVYAEIYF